MLCVNNDKFEADMAFNNTNEYLLECKAVEREA
jgi:hypothetical protein